MVHVQVAALAPPVLSALAAEMDHAGALCLRLEELVSRLIAEVEGEPRLLALSEAQTLDMLTQHLEALAGFMRGLSGQLAAGQLGSVQGSSVQGSSVQGSSVQGIDAQAVLAQVPLADLAARLRASLFDAAAAPAPQGGDGSGELDLF